MTRSLGVLNSQLMPPMVAQTKQPPPSLLTSALPSCLHLSILILSSVISNSYWSAHATAWPTDWFDICNPHFNVVQFWCQNGALKAPFHLHWLFSSAPPWLPHSILIPNKLSQYDDRLLLSCQTFVMLGSSTSSPFDCMKSCSDRAASLGFTPTRWHNCFCLHCVYLM